MERWSIRMAQVTGQVRTCPNMTTPDQIKRYCGRQSRWISIHTEGFDCATYCLFAHRAPMLTLDVRHDLPKAFAGSEGRDPVMPESVNGASDLVLSPLAACSRQCCRRFQVRRTSGDGQAGAQNFKSGRCSVHRPRIQFVVARAVGIFASTPVAPVDVPVFAGSCDITMGLKQPVAQQADECQDQAVIIPALGDELVARLSRVDPDI